DSSPAMRRSVVDLPQPEGASRTVSAPAGTSKLTSSTALVSPQSLLTRRTEMADMSLRQSYDNRRATQFERIQRIHGRRFSGRTRESRVLRRLRPRLPAGPRTSENQSTLSDREMIRRRRSGGKRDAEGRRATVKLVYTPNLIVRELTPDQRTRILAAEPRATI